MLNNTTPIINLHQKKRLKVLYKVYCPSIALSVCVCSFSWINESNHEAFVRQHQKRPTGPTTTTIIITITHPQKVIIASSPPIRFHSIDPTCQEKNNNKKNKEEISIIPNQATGASSAGPSSLSLPFPIQREATPL
ncbi:unnamed protein product [Periconia digitata]|uniref:Uncharacterized protein n=1 Tax=Periconia digitata TaxID=1303443 RepID=A0A9W4XJY5_9PLEO|nr:unnamed protein product [Periconia digitata]